jgi:hypothetical protein
LPIPLACILPIAELASAATEQTRELGLSRS